MKQLELPFHREFYVGDKVYVRRRTLGLKRFEKTEKTLIGFVHDKIVWDEQNGWGFMYSDSIRPKHGETYYIVKSLSLELDDGYNRASDLELAASSSADPTQGRG